MRKFLFALVLLASPVAAQTLPNATLTFEPFHASGLYRVGERVGWTVRAPLFGGHTRYSYEIRENNLKLLKQGVLDVSSGEAVLETTLDHPGMIYARLSFIGVPAPASPPAPQEQDKMTLGAAVAPEQIGPPAPKPADFDSFWAGKLAAL